MKREFKENKSGITLIALIITIIVLLILAGISISMISGENGILSQGEKAKETNEIGEERELVKLATIAALTEAKLDGREIIRDDLIIELDRTIGAGKYKLLPEGIEENLYNDKEKGYYFIVEYIERGRSYRVYVTGEVEDNTTSNGDNGNLEDDNLTPYKITYNSDEYDKQIEGVEGTVADTPIKKEKTTLSTGGFIKEGYHLIGWTTSDGSTTYDLGKEIETANITSDIILYAKWEVTNYTSKAGAFNTLEEAVEKTESEDTIKVVSNFTDDSTVNIDKSLTIDMNGKTLVRSKSIQITSGTTYFVGDGILKGTDFGAEVIINSATLVLDDRFKGTIENNSTGAYYAINNAGTLTISGSEAKVSGTTSRAIINSAMLNISEGTISSAKVGTINNATGAECNITGGTIFSKEGTTLMNYGKITIEIISEQEKDIYCENGKVISNYGTGNILLKNGKINATGGEGIYNEGTVTVKGGTVTGGPGINSKGTLNIEGGTINSNTSHALYLYGATTINNGTIRSLNTSCIRCDNGFSLEITGGTIESTGSVGIYSNYEGVIGEITIGKQGDALNKTSPSILSNSTVGISCGSGTTFNFYNGIITGKSTSPYTTKGENVNYRDVNTSPTIVYNETTGYSSATFEK